MAATWDPWHLGMDPARAGWIDRASPTDRASDAMDHGGIPEQIGVVLALEDAADLGLDEIRRLVDERIRAVPRLRQLLVGAPIGRGGPFWVDDPGFDIARHIRERRLPADANDGSFLDACLAMVMTPLPEQAPLWSVVLVRRAAGEGMALVVTLHHVLSDGMGALAVLDALRDPGLPPVEVGFPRPSPSPRALSADAWRRRWAALWTLPATVRDLRAAMSAAGGMRPVSAVPCSLVQPTGPRRRLATLALPAADLTEAAHRRGATTNDLIVTMVGGALGTVQCRRGWQHHDALHRAVLRRRGDRLRPRGPGPLPGPGPARHHAVRRVPGLH